MFYFNLAWGEVSTPLAVVRDIGIILTFLKILFNISFGWKIDALLCLIVFILFTILGIVLKKTGMSDYQNKLNNSINPEISLIADWVRRQRE